MKTLITSLLLVAIDAVGYGQKMPIDYFNEAADAADEGRSTEALAGFQYIVDHHPKNELYPRAFFNTSWLSYETKAYDKAKDVFVAILHSDFNETEALGGSIMADPYTNYRHRSSYTVYLMHKDEQQWDSALHYLALSDTVYPYQHFCGNAYASEAVYTALNYATLYQHLNQTAKEQEALCKAAFVSLADNQEVLNRLELLLQQRKDRKKLLAQLDKALESPNCSERPMGDEGESYTVCHITFAGSRIRLPHFYVNRLEQEPAEALKEFKASDFYQMVARL